MSGSMRLDSPRGLGQVPRSAELDPWLLWPAVALLLIGLVMVYSASIAVADSSRFTGHRPDFFLIRQAVFLLIGTNELAPSLDPAPSLARQREILERIRRESPDTRVFVQSLLPRASAASSGVAIASASLGLAPFIRPNNSPPDAARKIIPTTPAATMITVISTDRNAATELRGGLVISMARRYAVLLRKLRASFTLFPKFDYNIK